MDKRSWPWKKKTSEKLDANVKDKKKNVQISADTYARLIETEAQVKIFNEKLSSAHADITSKDDLVKQHAKVAEDAIAGWEKAEAEATALKKQLDSVTALKQQADDRALHLEDAVKECMIEIRNVKEESAQELQDTIFVKTKQCESIKYELDSRISELEQELLKKSAEIAALSKSLHERANMLLKTRDEKSQAETEIEVLKSHIQSCDKEINSMKYEVHVVTKELEIRNEEKNMSVKLAESANKQHLEDVKKISKLEAECQRLRGLVKKKLPGPAALAQMKVEVENLGRSSPLKSSSPYLSLPPNFSLEEMQHCQKENEYLTSQLLAAEEEAKMLKEALLNRNNELQATRSICSKTSSKLRSIEAQVLGMNHQKNSPKSRFESSYDESLFKHKRNQSIVSMSVDSIDEEGSCSESCSTILEDKSKNVDIMNDFLEMEKLACLSSKQGGVATNPVIDENLRNAITQIHDIVIQLSKEAIETQGNLHNDQVLQEKATELSSSICSEIVLDRFIFVLSKMLCEIRNTLSAKKERTGDGNSNDCIDKRTLSENQSDPTKPKLSVNLEEYEEMKAEKDSMEQQIADMKSQYAAYEKSISLSETQLKCMAESYKLLESRAQELESEINSLRSKVEALENELEQERESHEDDLSKLKNLQELYERDTKCTVCSVHEDADDVKAKQDREIAAAAEKLAECQETIFLLGKHLKSLKPQPDATSTSTDKAQTNAYSLQSILNTNHPDQCSTDNDDASSVILKNGEPDSPLSEYNSHFNSSYFESKAIVPPQEGSLKRKKNRTRSDSHSSVSSILSESQKSGFSRFFSRGKSERQIC